MARLFSSPLPVGVYCTSQFGSRIPMHLGDDYAGPKPGDKTPVYAVTDGTVSAVGGPAASTVLPYHSGKIVVIDHGILTDANGSDWIRTNSGHLSEIWVREGEKVVAGQQIGITGDTGNVTGVHLHLGVAQWNAKTRVWEFFDPSNWLARKGVVIGKTAPLKLGDVKPQGNIKPKPPAKPAASKPKPKTYTTVRRGSRNATVGKVQAALYKQGYTKQTRDNVFGAQTEANVRDFQRRTKLFQDGIAGPVTQKKLGL